MDTLSIYEQWNHAVGDLLLHVEDEGFLDHFVAALGQCVDFDQWFAVEFDLHAPPNRLGCDGLSKGQDDYEQGPYLLDPYYHSVFRQRDWPSFNRLSDIVEGQVVGSSYYQKYLHKWQTLDEVGYVVPVRKNTCVHFSISRSRSLPAFRREEIEFLRSLTSVVASVFYRHGRAQSQAGQRAVPRQSVHDTLAQAIDQFGREELTEREMEIARLMLKGYCARTMAPILGVTYGTAKNHMKSIYRKLGVASHIDMLVLFIDGLYDSG